jgi:hypothetical protein
MADDESLFAGEYKNFILDKNKQILRNKKEIQAKTTL